MSRGATARLFVAADPPGEVRVELAAWARDAAAGLAGPVGVGSRGGPGSLRVLDTELLHITLCFLGSRPVAEIDPLAAALPACAGHICELSLGAPLWLPPRRPGALAVAVHDEDGELGRLQGNVAAALASVSRWEAERRRFRAHITVARIRGGGGRRGAGPRSGPLPPATPSVRFAPESLTLYRSWLSPAGASYEALARCVLVPG